MSGDEWVWIGDADDMPFAGVSDSPHHSALPRAVPAVLDELANEHKLSTGRQPCSVRLRLEEVYEEAEAMSEGLSRFAKSGIACCKRCGQVMKNPTYANSFPLLTAREQKMCTDKVQRSSSEYGKTFVRASIGLRTGLHSAANCQGSLGETLRKPRSLAEEAGGVVWMNDTDRLRSLHFVQLVTPRPPKVFRSAIRESSWRGMRSVLQKELHRRWRKSGITPHDASATHRRRVESEWITAHNVWLQSAVAASRKKLWSRFSARGAKFFS